ncbi:MAG: copper amine oxidase [Gaiellaceae bacterium]
MKTRILLPLLVLVLAALGLAACGGDDDGDTEGTPAQTGETTTEMPDGMGEATTMSPAADLRSTLDTLLGEHAMLAMFATQKGLAGDPDFEAIAGALDENSVELSEAIGSVYGDEAAQQFLDGPSLWRDHISFFVDYTVGLAKKDKAAQQEAVENLTGYTGAFSGFLAEATGLPQDAVQESITEHVMQLKGQIDAYAAKDYGQGYGLVREAYAHMFMTGDTLAGAIGEQSPDDFPLDPATEAAADLRITLNRLLGEHAILAMTATQKGLTGAKDFEAIAGALDENAVELSEAIGSVYGDEAAQQFLDGPSLWRDHISFFVDYTVGLATKDKAAQDKAVEDLTGYTGAFSGFLAEATGLPQDALQESITQHVMQLKGQIDAYAAGDYEEAYRLFREAYAHMVMTGDTLAEAIVAQNPDEFGG